MNATLQIRADELAKQRVRARLHTDKSLAEAMGADRGTVNKVLNGRAKPGPDFIASLLAALNSDVSFGDLFHVVSKEAA